MITATLIASYLSLFFGILGIIILFISGIKAFIQMIKLELFKDETINFDDLRVEFASKILFVLDFFIVADLIKTVFDPTMDQIITLGIIVAIRTVTSYSLNREINNTKK